MFMLDAPDDSTVLVVALNNPANLARKREGGWYRIPMNRAARRIAADYLAFYLTGAFEPGERWQVRWLAPVHRYHIATRRELIPEEPDHSHAGELYYKVALGTLTPLPRPVPSRWLRRPCPNRAGSLGCIRFPGEVEMNARPSRGVTGLQEGQSRTGAAHY